MSTRTVDRSWDKVPEEYSKDDKAGRILAREQYVREKFVKVENAKMLREELVACYRKEGVNHLQNCREIAVKYKKAIEGVSIGK